MTNREYIRQQLSAYLDGELDARDAAQVEQALSADAELAAELSQLQAVRESLRRLGVERAPEDFASRLMDRVERRQLMHLHAPGKLEANWVRYAVMAAVALIALSVGVMTAITIYSASRSQGHSLAVEKSQAPVSGPDAALAMADKVDKYGYRQKEICEQAKTGDLDCVIATDSLPRTQRELEDELKKNSIQPVRQARCGDEEVVYEGQVDHAQVEQLKQVVSNIRTNNLGAEISFKKRSEERLRQQQFEGEKKSKDLSDIACLNRDDKEYGKQDEPHKGGDGIGGICRNPASPGGAGVPSEEGKLVVKKSENAADQTPATSPAARSSEDGVHAAQKPGPTSQPAIAQTQSPASQNGTLNGCQLANGWQSDTNGKRYAQRFQIRLQYHPSITQSREAQNSGSQSGNGYNGLPTELRNQASQASQPATDTNSYINR